MVFIKRVVNANPGDADHWGGNDIDLLDSYYDNIDITPKVATINTLTHFRSSKFGLRNPANTFSYIHVAAALAGNRNVNWPLLTADDEPLFKTFPATISGKTLDSSCDVSAAVGSAAPVAAQYVTLATHATLTAERVLTAGDGISLTDAGANGNITVADDIIDRARKRVQIYDDFFGSTTNNVTFIVTVAGAGSVANYAVAETGIFGVWEMDTGTGTTDSAGIKAGQVSSFSLGQGPATFECYIKIPTLSAVGDEYIFRVGFGDSNTALPVDCVLFEYDRLTSVNWRIRCRSNSVSSSTNSTTAVGTGWTRLKIVVNAAGTSVDFFIAGSNVGTIATNIPIGAGRELTLIASIIKSAGSTARQARIDYVALDYDLTTPR